MPRPLTLAVPYAPTGLGPDPVPPIGPRSASAPLRLIDLLPPVGRLSLIGPLPPDAPLPLIGRSAPVVSFPPRGA
ncbi:MAG TPA: hypothetical protein VFG35_08740 [Actinoplanes sp.]|nr:hypothetical protein [Actinoplanes sp.]